MYMYLCMYVHVCIYSKKGPLEKLRTYSIPCYFTECPLILRTSHLNFNGLSPL